MSLSPIPSDRPQVSPYLIVADVPQLISFIQTLFQGEVTERIHNKEKQIMHAEIKVGDSLIMLGQATDEHSAISAMIHIYVENVDDTYSQAIDLGASSLSEPANQFYGERTAGVIGPQGNFWWIASQIEKLSEEEIEIVEESVR